MPMNNPYLKRLTALLVLLLLAFPAGCTAKDAEPVTEEETQTITEAPDVVEETEEAEVTETPEEEIEEVPAEEIEADEEEPEELPAEAETEGTEDQQETPAADAPQTTPPAKPATPTEQPQKPAEPEVVPQAPKTSVFRGIVIDKCCLDDPGPEEDTWDCLLMDSCRDSGYGLAIPNGSGGYDWIPFDAKGQDMAFQCIYKSSRYTKITLEVTGILENGIIQVHSMKEV